MDVFLVIRRKKQHMFCDAKENNNVFELKKIVEGILKIPPENQRLYKLDDEKDAARAKLLEDNQLLSEVGLTSATARAQLPAFVGLAIKQPDGGFESLEVTKVSDPPELPDVMKAPRSADATSSDAAEPQQA